MISSALENVSFNNKLMNFDEADVQSIIFKSLTLQETPFIKNYKIHLKKIPRDWKTLERAEQSRPRKSCFDTFKHCERHRQVFV